MSDQSRLLKLWERTSAKGTRYYSGFMGDVQVLMFDAGEKPHPTRPGETVHVWRLMAQERDPERRSVRRDPPPAPVVTEQSRDAHRDELAARFQPDTEIPF